MPIKPARPLRHRAGKPTGNSSSSDSESSEDEKPAVAPPPKVPSAGKIISASGLNQVDLNERRRIAQEQEEKRKAAEAAARVAAEEGFVTEEESAEDNEDGEGEEEESSEEESSEDEVPRRALMMRPKFVPKSQRNAGNRTEEQHAAEQAAVEARRKAETDALIEEQLRKDNAAKAAGKNYWDDAMDSADDVDTEDDKDPETELAAWKVRELKRVKREREAVEEAEKQQAEVERRRNLTEEERRAEDEAHLERQREEKEGRGKMAFLGKYHHRGAFYQDEAPAAGLENRNLMGARFEDEVDRSLLPKALQLRDMTKLGRKGASKYRDLQTEDTGRWGEFRDHRPGKDFGGGYDVDERFRSDRDRERSGPGGANAVPLGDRKSEGTKNREGRRDEEGYGDRDQGRDQDWDRDRSSYKSRDDYDRRREPSTSRSPRRDRRDRDDYSRKRRSLSRDADRHESDKRRRVDSS